MVFWHADALAFNTALVRIANATESLTAIIPTFLASTLWLAIDTNAVSAAILAGLRHLSKISTRVNPAYVVVTASDMVVFLAYTGAINAKRPFLVASATGTSTSIAATFAAFTIRSASNLLQGDRPPNLLANFNRSINGYSGIAFSRSGDGVFARGKIGKLIKGIIPNDL